MSNTRTESTTPFTIARGRVAAVERVSPTFVRITFAGPDLDDVGTPGVTFDQRIKLVFPPASGVLPDLRGAGTDWYRAWLELPEDARGTMRTYSIREVRVGARARTEIVIDFVLHFEPGLTGPAARWAARAAVGDELLIVGPRRGRFDGGGIEYDPSGAGSVLLAGDETAAPAIARILEDAPATLTGAAFIEVPTARDALDVAVPPGVTLRWLPRDEAGPGGGGSGPAGHGERLIPAVLARCGAGPGGAGSDGTHEAGASAGGADPAAGDAATDLPLWETPHYSGLGEALEPGVGVREHPAAAARALADRYFWIAGESGVVTTLRRHLVASLGVSRSQVAFMGYWRHGVAMR